MLLGAHESVSGGPSTAFGRGREDGCASLQIFARPSAQWRSRALDAEEVARFRSERTAAGWPVFSHASYLINLCAGDDVILEKSRIALQEELERGDELGLDYVVLHPGAHLGAGDERGLAGIVESLSLVYRRTRGVKPRLLIELTAGQGSCLGCRFEHLATIFDGADGGETMGLCFDTCHALAAGYDLTTEAGYDAVFEELDRVVGLSRLKAFHLNDSKTPLGSRVDRHAEIGEGFLGLYPFWRLVNDPRFAAVPGVLEIPPGKGPVRAFKTNLDRLRSLIDAPRPTMAAPSQVLPERGTRTNKRKPKPTDSLQTSLVLAKD